MTLCEITTALYVVPTVVFVIASLIVFDLMIDSVNEKLPRQDRLTRWKIMSRRDLYIEVIAIYRRYYPCGNLARLYWVCLGFAVLSGAGAFFCFAIISQR